MLKFRHIDTQQTLNTIKFSADSTNTTYFLHSSPNTQSQGVPDVNYEDICFIKPTGQEYTHGKLYGGESDNKVTALLDEYLNKTKLTHTLPPNGVAKGIILDGCEPSLNYNTNNQPNGYKISNGTIYLIGIGIIKVTGHRVHTPKESSEWFVVYGIHETSNTDKTTWDYHIYGQIFGPDHDSSILDEGQVANDVCRSLDLYRLSDLEVPIASDLQNGLMSKEDKIKLDNHTDEYLDYLHKLCTEHSKYAIILSGCTVEPTNVQDTYQRKGGYVYIDSINQIKKVNDGTISLSTTIEDSLYCNSQNGGNSKTYAFGAATNPSNLDNQYAKVCDWSGLARLSDLEVPMATEYQNGLVRVDSELNASSPNPIANNAIANRLAFVHGSYLFNQNHNRAICEYILLCTIKFTFNSGVATLYLNQEFNIGSPFMVKADIFYSWKTVLIQGGQPGTLSLKAEVDDNLYVRIYLKLTYRATGQGVYTILGNLSEIIPNDEF